MNIAMRKHGGDKWRGRLPVPEHVDPAVKELFERMNEERVVVTEVAQRAGLRRNTVSTWRYNRAPTIHNLRAALNALGYDLKVVRLP